MDTKRLLLISVPPKFIPIPTIGALRTRTTGMIEIEKRLPTWHTLSEGRSYKMTYQLRTFFLLGLVLLAGCATKVPTPDYSYLVERLPRNYLGVFRWHGDSTEQNVSIAINEVFFDAQKNIVAKGTGKYLTMFREKDIEIKIAIVPETLRFEMWEKNPDGADDFITDGSHIGELSKDLKTITAVWTTGATGQQGDLKLEAK